MIALEVKELEESSLQRVSMSQAGGGRKALLTLLAGVDDQRFSNAAQFFQEVVDGEGLPGLS